MPNALLDFDDFVFEVGSIVTICTVAVFITITPVCKTFTVHFEAL